MLNSPKTPLNAVLIFFAGIGVIAYTTLDVQRSMRANEAPLTPEQRAAFEEFSQRLKEHKEAAAGGGQASSKWD